MIRVSAPSRLHFGLFALPAKEPAAAPHRDSGPPVAERFYGGVGLMIDRPGVRVAIEPAAAWCAEGPSAARALKFGRRIVNALPADQRLSTFRVIAEQSAPEHVGLGTGTQVGLAVARALAIATGHADWDAAELGRRIGRGQRSGVGIHGFQHGGLIVEGGKTNADAVSPLLVRRSFPDDWRVLLIASRGQQGIHGGNESAAFAELASQAHDCRRTETLSRLALLGLLPALVEGDLPMFAEALHEFNRRAGEWFLPWQGGLYADAATEERIGWLRRQGIRGVGQSSWGPTIFAVELRDALESIRQRLLDQGEFHEDELVLCGAANHGAECRED